MTRGAIHLAALRTLIFITPTGRHITGADVAEDAAEELMGKHGAKGTREQLIEQVDYYAEGHTWGTETWAEALEQYVTRLVDMGRADRVAEVRGWVMPVRDVAIAAE